MGTLQVSAQILALITQHAANGQCEKTSYDDFYLEVSAGPSMLSSAAVWVPPADTGLHILGGGSFDALPAMLKWAVQASRKRYLFATCQQCKSTKDSDCQPSMHCKSHPLYSLQPPHCSQHVTHFCKPHASSPMAPLCFLIPSQSISDYTSGGCLPNFDLSICITLYTRTMCMACLRILSYPRSSRSPKEQ